jgi:hypothetical protein
MYYNSNMQSVNSNSASVVPPYTKEPEHKCADLVPYRLFLQFAAVAFATYLLHVMRTSGMDVALVTYKSIRNIYFSVVAFVLFALGILISLKFFSGKKRFYECILPAVIINILLVNFSYAIASIFNDILNLISK